MRFEVPRRSFFIERAKWGGAARPFDYDRDTLGLGPNRLVVLGETRLEALLTCKPPNR
jgi:hypothetical protein